MELPKFLLADNSKESDRMYVVHTEYPKFILDVTNEDILWIDQWEENDDDAQDEMLKITEEALQFFDDEMDALEE